MVNLNNLLQKNYLILSKICFVLDPHTETDIRCAGNMGKKPQSDISSYPDAFILSG